MAYMLTELEDVVHKNLLFLVEGTNFAWIIFIIKSLVNKGMIATGQIGQDVRLLRVFLKVWRFEWGLKLELPVAYRKSRMLFFIVISFRGAAMIR